MSTAPPPTPECHDWCEIDKVDWIGWLCLPTGQQLSIRAPSQARLKIAINELAHTLGVE